MDIGQFLEYLTEKDIVSFWHITHINNLKSILEYGILPRKVLGMNRISYTSIAITTVLARWPKSREFVRLYLVDNTPMLYVVCSKHKNKIILLELSTDLLRSSEMSIISNGNASSSDTEIMSISKVTTEWLNNKIDWKLLKSRYAAYSSKWKRMRAAEVIISPKVEPKYIKCIHVIGDENTIIAEKVNGTTTNKSYIEIRNDLTYKGLRGLNESNGICL